MMRCRFSLLHVSYCLRGCTNEVRTLASMERAKMLWGYPSIIANATGGSAGTTAKQTMTTAHLSLACTAVAVWMALIHSCVFVRLDTREVKVRAVLCCVVLCCVVLCCPSVACHFVCVFTEMCEVSSALDPVWRDVRGAYAIDPGQHVLLNPVSRVNVGIGKFSPHRWQARCYNFTLWCTFRVVETTRTVACSRRCR
jgi:hypothetical protein